MCTVTNLHDSCGIPGRDSTSAIVFPVTDLVDCDGPRSESDSEQPPGSGRPCSDCGPESEWTPKTPKDSAGMHRTPIGPFLSLLLRWTPSYGTADSEQLSARLHSESAADLARSPLRTALWI